MPSAPRFARNICLAAVAAATPPTSAEPLIGTPTGLTQRPIAESAAESVGLTRDWFTQAAVDPARGRVVGAALGDDSLYLLTSTGTLQAIDRHTGASRWSKRLSHANTLPLGPALSAGRIAVVVGVTLHVVDASDGRPALLDELTGRRTESRRLEAAPGAHPAMSDTHVYVPASNGRLMVLSIDPEESLPLRIASPGELMVRPVVANDRVVWSTMSGDVYAIPLDGRGQSLRVEDAGVIAGPAMPLGEHIVMVSRVGAVVAKRPRDGRRLWRASLGERAAGAGDLINGVAYVPTASGATHAIDAETGETKWVADGLAAAISATDERVYGLDPYGALVMLDAADGRMLGALPGASGLTAVNNPIDDRIYLVSPDGLVQSLHETELAEPLRHDGVPAGEAVVESDPGDETDEAAASPQNEEPAVFGELEEPSDAPALDDPFADPGTSDDGADNPFGDDPFADF